jgi:MIP family channel proteins
MNIRAIVAELIGTFILVGFGTMSVVSAGASGVPATLIVPFGFGLALLAGIAIFGHVSGGHFNPAVTLAAVIDGRLGIVDAIGYAIAQVVGAVIGSMSILVLFGKSVVDSTRNSPADVITDPQAFGIEAILTAVFIAVILTTTARAARQAVFVIPLVLTMIHFIAIPISGASVNPARSLGPAIVSGNYVHLWVYLTAPFLGAIIGWGLYRLMGILDEGDGQDAQADRAIEDDLLDYEDEA